MKKEIVRHTSWQIVKRQVLNLDIHKRHFELLIPGGEQNYKTFLGSLISFFTIILMFQNTIVNSLKLINITDFKLLETEEENYFPIDQTFGTTDGFQIGAAITAYDQNPDSIEDPTIGTLEFYMKEFGSTFKGINFRKLPTKPCDFNDVEGSNENSPFYPTYYDSENLLKTYGQKMKCIDGDI